MKNGTKQILRTPWRTGLFFLLIALSIALFTVGTNLWLQISKNIKAADEAFVTIGTVTQKENTTVSKAQWDAALKDYIYFESQSYNELFSVDILNAAGVEYMTRPEHRPYYGAVSDDFIARSYEQYPSSSLLIAEIQPIEDCIPDKPVKVKVINSLWGGDGDMTDHIIYFCDHFSEQTRLMESDKTYIAYLITNPYNVDKHEGMPSPKEYVPIDIFEGQSSRWYEVHENFYESSEGKRWQSMITDLKKTFFNAVPVTPTAGTQLLYAFHQGEAVIESGRDITVEEYESGAKICLISQHFAELNGFEVGDTFNLQLYFTDCKNSAAHISYIEGGLDSNVSLISKEEPLDTFYTADYEVAGIYSYAYSYAQAAHETGYGFGMNEIIIPTASVTETSNQNIIEDGPMKEYNTSFQIKNGTIDEVMERLTGLPEANYLEFKFYDNGYEQFADGLETMKIISVILFLVGLASAVAIIIFFLYFSIIKQQKRTAIECALGTPKRQSYVSLLSGVVILTISGAICGAAGGAFSSHIVFEQTVTDIEFFRTDYTKGQQQETGEEIAFEMKDNILLVTVVLTVIGTILLVSSIALVLIRKSLSISPIYLLGRRDVG